MGIPPDQPPPANATPKRPLGAGRALAWALTGVGLALALFQHLALQHGHAQASARLVAAVFIIAGLGVEFSLHRVRRHLRQLEILVAEQKAHAFVRARLDGVLRAADQIGIISTDLDGVIRVFNTGAERMLGYSAAELVGKANPERFHLPQEVEAVSRELSQRLGQPLYGFQAVVATLRLGGPGAHFERQWTMIRKDGHRLTVELSITGIYTDNDELEGYLAVAQDITERKALEARLRQAQLCVDNAGDMIFWATMDEARIVYANQAAINSLGYTHKELLSLCVPDLNPTRTLYNWRAQADFLREHGSTTAGMHFRTKSGRLFPVESTSTLVEHEGVQYAMGMVRDITRRKALEAELNQSQVSMDNVQDMVLWTRTSDGRIAFANRAADRLLGYEPGGLLGLTVQTINPRRTPENWRQVCESLRHQDIGTNETTFVRKDGSPMNVEAKTSLITHEGEEYAVGIIRDITLRKADEKRLAAETALNRSVAEAARMMLSVAPDMNTVAQLLLDRACRLTGSRHGYVAFVDHISGGLQPRAMSAMMTSGECTLGALPVSFPKGDDGRYRGLWGHSLNTRKPFFDNAPSAHPSAAGLPDGHVPITQLISAPAVAKNRLVGQIALANPGRDYTQADLDIINSLVDVFALGAEQIMNQRALMDEKIKAEESSRSKSEFLSNMSHEFRTPLNGVLGMLQVLKTTELSPEQEELAQLAQESAERLNLVLNNVIEYARLETDPTRLDCMPFPLSDLLRALENDFAHTAQRTGVELRVTKAPNLPAMMESDPQALRQALSHTLDNAFKFTPAGHVTLAAELDPADPALLQLRVEDTGIGIPPDVRRRVFEAFAQADAGITRAYGGGGLGLAIVRKLAERLGGRVAAAENPQGGTVIILTVPLLCPGKTP